MSNFHDLLGKRELLISIHCFLIGIIFLLLSLTVLLSTVLWVVSLGTNVSLNFTDIIILIKFIKATKESK